MISLQEYIRISLLRSTLKYNLKYVFSDLYPVSSDIIAFVDVNVVVANEYADSRQRDVSLQVAFWLLRKITNRERDGEETYGDVRVDDAERLRFET